MWFNGLISNNTTFLNKPKTKLPKNLIKLILKLKKKTRFNHHIWF